MVEKIRDYSKLAKNIIHEAGGEKNIVSATRCATRLRLVLTDTPKEAKEKIAGIPGVIAAVEKDGQFQVVLGNQVGEVYEEVVKELGLNRNAEIVNAETEKAETDKGSGRSIFKRLITTMSAVFAPSNTIEQNNTMAEQQEMAAKDVIGSPVNGKTVALSEIKDKVFASGVMGPGIAVIPEEGKIYAPADGKISMLFDTLHAFGMETKQGVELLIHVGMDTVKLKERYFTSHTKTGAEVKKGDLLLEFDMQKIKEAGYELTTPVIVTNSEKYTDISIQKPGRISAGDMVILIK